MDVNHRFLEQRSVALATVLLTRHPNVMVSATQAGERHLFDLQATISRSGALSGRMFGVELRSVLQQQRVGHHLDANVVRLTARLRLSLEQVRRRSHDLPFPLLYIVFAMDSDRGFYGWLREPESPPKRLVSVHVKDARWWGPDSHTDVIGRIDRWYDAGTKGDCGR